MKMIGEFVFDQKKNTASAKHVNDRLRRRAKRVERRQLEDELTRRDFFCALFGR